MLASFFPLSPFLSGGESTDRFVQTFGDGLGLFGRADPDLVFALVGGLQLLKESGGRFVLLERLFEHARHGPFLAWRARWFRQAGLSIQLDGSMEQGFESTLIEALQTLGQIDAADGGVLQAMIEKSPRVRQVPATVKGDLGMALQATETDHPLVAAEAEHVGVDGLLEIGLPTEEQVSQFFTDGLGAFRAGGEPFIGILSA